MEWLSQYQLFLFDLDGLLVNTEELHFRAYQKMCRDRGFVLPWDFPTYFGIAQQDAEAPKRYIYAQFPELFKQEPSWDVLYSEKKCAFMELLEKEKVPLMPGVEKLLLALQERGIKRACVTHSGRELVEKIKAHNPILETIPHWFTRETYQYPKPSPDGYLRAIRTLAEPHDRIIGFEDSVRGMNALLGTSATPIFVNSFDAAARQAFESQGIRTLRSLEARS